VAQEAAGQLAGLSERELQARGETDELSRGLAAALTAVQTCRGTQFDLEARLESARGQRDRARAEVMSIEALQRAALGQADSRANDWLRSSGLGDRPRLAEALQVDAGYERAVETVLGDYLEAVCVEAVCVVAVVLT